MILISPLYIKHNKSAESPFFLFSWFLSYILLISPMNMKHDKSAESLCFITCCKKIHNLHLINNMEDTIVLLDWKCLILIQKCGSHCYRKTSNKKLSFQETKSWILDEIQLSRVPLWIEDSPIINGGSHEFTITVALAIQGWLSPKKE